MTLNADTEARRPDDEVREIPKWARRYAQNRTLPVLVFFVIFVAGGAVFAGLSLLTGFAHVFGLRVLAIASMTALCAFFAFWIWFSFFGAAPLIDRISQWLYRREGSVTIGIPQVGFPQVGFPPKAEHKQLLFVAFVYMFCVLAGIGLGFLRVYPLSLMQPVSALYVVPFLCYLGWRLRAHRIGSPFMFLWPTLYAIHAILIVAGAPISMGPVLDMFVPTIGYGFLAALAAHLYSRIALRRLRHLGAGSDSGQPAQGV